MANRPAAELAQIALPVEPDPELEALPAPRRPGRTLTLVTMAVTAALALVMTYELRGEASYSLREGTPTALGNLTELTPRPELANTWVQGEGLMGSTHAVRYSRPLESGSYRLAPIAGNDRLWVQVRVPENMEGPHFVPPTSFVGRMVPLSAAGIRHSGLKDAAERAVQGGKLPADAWLLIEGEAPSTTRWALGLVLLFVAFAAFNVWGLTRLLRPVEDG
ncbi:MAG: hypothetical protein IPI67_07240 [Myxococcales bacterium]|nr:hypothetical protein [Myxococcales bacterium]